MISTISYDQYEIIDNIIKLHLGGQNIEVDPTYSKGVFYNNTGIIPPKFKFDINPSIEEVVQADCRKLPFKEGVINSIMFDPPFLATTKSVDNTFSFKEDLINNRFGSYIYKNEKELFQFYLDSLKEFHRILRNKGILIFKCQDKISGGKQYFSHLYIHNMAVSLGFYPKDLFVLLVKHRLTFDWQKESQKHARKFHSYFWVFEKQEYIGEYNKFLSIYNKF